MNDSRPTNISVNDPAFTSLCLEILNNGHNIRFVAHGLSMTPCIRDGEIVTVVPVAACNLRVGDIVLYRTPDDRLTAHRLLSRAIGKSGSVFRMRGDASTAFREMVPADCVLGRVAYVERDGRKHRLDGQFGRFLHLCRSGILQIRAKAGRKIREAGARFRVD
jgi:hypothetical protein